MVKYDTLVKVIGTYVEKCQTIAEKKQILSQMDFQEKYAQLESQSLVNKGEIQLYGELHLHHKHLMEHFEDTVNLIEDYAQKLETEGEFDDAEYEREKIQALINRKETVEDKMFQLERRILDGYDKRPKEVDGVNENDFSSEKQIDGAYTRNTIGELEQAHIDNQKGIGLNDDEISALQQYFGAGAKTLNSKLYDSDTWNSVPIEDRKLTTLIWNDVDRNLHNAIKKSNGMLEDTTLYHGGFFDVSKLVGDKVKFKGYVSASFQENVGLHFARVGGKPFTHGGEKYTYKLLVKKGTKGLCANDTQYGKLTNHSFEEEVLLDKNFVGTITHIDYDNKIVTLIKDD